MFALGFAVSHFAAMGPTENSSPSTPTEQFFTLSLPDAQGNMQNVSQYKGKIVVLNFWASWCPPCREEMPELSQLHQKYQNKNVVVLGVAIDDLDAVKEFLKSAPVSYPVLVAKSERMDLSNQLGNDQDVLPYTLIINTDGTVAKNYFGRINEPLLETTIDALLPH